MQPNQWEVLVLKPTPTFIPFLQSHFQDVPLPEFKLLQTDNTGYVIQKQNTEEALLDEIESQYLKMFRFEIKRWLKESVQSDIQVSFLDFLCCFKFELHSHMVLMEDALIDGRQMICLKPRSTLLKWIQSKYAEIDFEVVTDLHVSQLAENGTVIVKNIENVYDVKPFLRLHYYTMFEAEMRRMCGEFSEALNVDSYQMFCRYFMVEYHSQLVHLT